MRILIVDDEPNNRKLLERIVSANYECISVACGEEALTAFKDAWDEWRPFTFILMDVMMPGLSGDETLLRIRNMEQLKRVQACHRAKIFMVTATSAASVVERCRDNKCDGYILKPFDRLNLMAKIRRAISA
jgi:CheY-like chemotaxis protein